MGLFIDSDPQTVHDSVIAYLQDEIGEVLPEGDERRIFAESLTAYLVAVLSDFDNRAKQRLLRYARGNALDAIGEMYGCDRLLAQPSACTIRFTAEQPAATTITVPVGTIVSAADGTQFATVEDAEVAAGGSYADAPAEALDAGAALNGLVPGTISILEDAIPGIESAENIDTTSGGADGEDDDDDGNDAYRARIELAQNSVNTAGAAWAYRYHALNSRADVADAQVPEPVRACEVSVYVMKKGGGGFSESELAEVQAAVAADDVRALCDKVTVWNAVEDGYRIDMTWTCDDSVAATVTEAVEGEGGAVDQYVAWQDSRIGRDVNPQKLMAYVFAAGAATCAVRSPSAHATADGHCAVCTHRTVARAVV